MLLPSAVSAISGLMTMLRGSSAGGADPSDVGYSEPAEFGMGTLNPDQYRGNTVTHIITNAPDQHFTLKMLPINIPNNDIDAFTKVRITTTESGGFDVTFTRSALSYSGSIGGYTRWRLTGNTDNFPSGTYRVIFS